MIVRRRPWRAHPPLAAAPLAAALIGCATHRAVRHLRPPGGAASARPPEGDVRGAWRVADVAARAPGDPWVARPGPPSGLYVFAARHYSYFYVPGAQPRPRFADATRPTEAEKAGAYDTMIAGAGTYTFDGRTLAMATELRKNPSETTGGVWRWQAEARGDTLRLVLERPPFLPGREWRVTLVRVE